MHFTADSPAEFNFEAYKAEVEERTKKARKSLYGDW